MYCSEYVCILLLTRDIFSKKVQNVDSRNMKNTNICTGEKNSEENKGCIEESRCAAIAERVPLK